MPFRVECCECTYETKAAIKVESDEFLELTGETEEWIPKSQVDSDSEVYAKGHEGTLIISDWLAEQKGWE